MLARFMAGVVSGNIQSGDWNHELSELWTRKAQEHTKEVLQAARTGERGKKKRRVEINT